MSCRGSARAGSRPCSALNETAVERRLRPGSPHGSKSGGRMSRSVEADLAGWFEVMIEVETVLTKGVGTTDLVR